MDDVKTFNDVRSFNAEIAKLTKTLPREQITLVQKKLALQFLRGVVMKTPVDTGRARGGWTTTINKPSLDLVEAVRDAPEVFAEAAAVLGDLEAYRIVWIANNVEYLVWLEEGTSKQAPAGMVSVTLAELAQSFEE